MSIAFLEGAEYAYATEETVMTIDYSERYDDERLAQGNEYLIFNMRDDLVAAITELRSTIAAQQDTIDDGARLLEQAHGRTADHAETIQWCSKQIFLLHDIIEAYKRYIATTIAEARAQREHVEELEVACCIGKEALAAKDARIAELEAAISNGQLYAEGCMP